MNRRAGIAFALTTALFWGALPVVLKVLLSVLDPYTLTALRFATAAVILIVAMLALRRISSILAQLRSDLRWLALALVGLLGNFIAFIVGLGYTSATVAQVIAQLGPVFLLFGGVLFFREHLNAGQRWGVVSLLAGLALFFNQKLADFAHVDRGFLIGIAFGTGGAVLWSLYGLAQKKLAKHFKAQETLTVLYAASALCLWPLSTPSEVAQLTSLHLWLLAFACVNTVIAYGAFAESLKRIEASRAAAIVCVTPLLTAAFAALAGVIAPTLAPHESLNAASYIGVAVVVIGCATCVVGGSRAPAPATNSARAAGR